MSDMSSMQNAIKILKSKIKLFKQSQNKILNIINDELENFINRLHVNSLSLFQYRLAIWYAENKNYSFAYVSLTEAIVSAICEDNDLNALDKDDRQKAKDILYKYGDYKTASPQKQKLNKNYNKIKNIRNAISHNLADEAKKTNITTHQSIENIPLYINNVRELFKDKS